LVHVPVEVNLAPGKEIELAELKLDPRTATQSVHEGQWNLFETGKFTVQYERLAHSDIDKLLSKLATGKLDLEFKFKAPPEDEKKVPPKQKGEEDKQAFTAWGKEINGLQAGLGFRAGQRRAYAHGETVRVVLRVRNVGKEAVEFSHIWAFFFENPPTITDPEGKPIQLPVGAAEGRHMPRSPKVGPGEEIDLFTWSFDLRPKGERGDTTYPLARGRDWVLASLQGTGKFTIHCERVVGPTTSNPNDPNPALSKLATGKLELEVKEAKKPEKPDQEKPDAPRELTVGGWVVDEDGKPVDGAVVTIQRKTYAKGAEQPRTEEFGKTQTDSKGRFEIKSLTAVRETEPRSGFHLTFSAPGMAPDSLGVGKGFDPKKEIKITLKRKKEKEEKETPTAWGKEVGGLQAGVGVRAGEERPHTHGETIDLVVRVRNVGMEAVRFRYVREFFGVSPPDVTDGAGKAVLQPWPGGGGSAPVPVEVKLAPGKEIELAELKLELRPAGENEDYAGKTLHGTEKVRVEYVQLFGLAETPDPILSKLATGQSELEINPKKN
jgi:hypothetical protein